MEAKEGQIQQQDTELEEGVVQLSRQQRELQTLRVRNGYYTVQISNDPMHLPMLWLLGGQRKAAGRGGH